MRRRVIVLVAVFALGMTFSFFSGCSDDNGTNSNGIDPQDSAFVGEFFSGDIFLRSLQSIPVSLELLGTVDGAAKIAPSALASLSDDEEIIINSIIEYSYTNGWHIFDFSAMIIDLDEHDTVDIAGIDSVQILENGEPVRVPVDSNNIDGLKARAYIDWELRGESNRGDVNHRIDVGLDPGVLDTIVTVDGSVHDTMEVVEDDFDGTCSIFAALDQTVTNLQIRTPSNDDCPLDGQVASTATLDVLCIGNQGAGYDTLQVTGAWTVTATVNDNNTVTITYSDGTVSWTVTEPCGQSATMKPRGWAAIRR